ncbi:MAG: phage head closure protein [Desulfovibrio sp.]|jgi:SPP1 family predicted phage head-tail adaptor|nr:phage head closure protein [Desulfovibrio sp.]
MADYYFLASRLNSRATFFKKEKTRKPDGTFNETWVEYKTTFAEVVTIGGEEGRLAAAQSSEVRYRIRIRYRKDIDASMKIRVADGRELAIGAIRDPDGRRVMLEIHATWKQGGV